MMNTALATFTFHSQGTRAEHSQDVRIVNHKGDPWFVAADVCRVLGHSNTAMALKSLDYDEFKKITLSNPYGIMRGNPSRLVISEPGLYKLIQSSRRPEAKVFDRWVRHEVLPAIRKDGAYFMGEEKVRTGEMNEDEFILKAIKMLEAKVERLKSENAVMSEKLNFMTVQQFLSMESREYHSHSFKVTLGHMASKTCRDRGINFEEVPKTLYRYGRKIDSKVYRYPVSILREAKDQLVTLLT